MARPSNTVSTVSMSLSLTPQMMEYLDEMATLGTFGGGSPQDVAKYLLQNAVNELIRNKDIGRRRYKAIGEGKVVRAKASDDDLEPA